MPARKRPIRAIDVCAGGGGWACAARGLPIEVVLAIDLWKPACKTYALNHPETKVVEGDLRHQSVRDLVSKSRAELVLGGIPCEWLSVYRNLEKVKEEELEDQRATLDSVLGLVRQLSPRWWVLEDVTGLIPELPVFTPYKILNSSCFSAQRRKRVYVGKFPSPAARGSCQTMGEKLRPGPYRIGPRAADRTPVVRRSFTPTEALAAYPDRKSPTVLAWCSRRDAEVVVVDEQLSGGKRQIEWQEAAALQGFPNDYVFWGSPTDVGKMIGRAVQIDTGRAILEAIVAEAGL